MSVDGGPILTTERLSLRPVSEEDTDELHRLWCDPQVRRFLWDDIIIPRATAAEVVRTSVETFVRFGFGLWAARDRGATGPIVGFCGLRLFEDAAAPQQETMVEIVYGLEPSRWGLGLATEAARAVLEHGFEHCGLERIYAGADPPNRHSFRVMERLGMRPWQRLLINGLEADYYFLDRSL